MILPQQTQVYHTPHVCQLILSVLGLSVYTPLASVTEGRAKARRSAVTVTETEASGQGWGSLFDAEQD